MLRNITNDRSSYRPKKSLLWQKCTNLRTLKQIHASMLVSGFNSDASSLREFIFAASVSISCTIDYAHQVFAFISQPDTFMWNSLIRGSSMSRNPSNAISLFAQMQRCHVSPDLFTFPCLLKACSKLSFVRSGCAIHGKVLKLGFDPNSFIRNALINFHSNCGDLGVARALFDEDSARRDVVAWSAMTAGYARRGHLAEARRLFDAMPEQDLVSWNVMITGYAKSGDMETARRLFDKAPRRDVVTWNVIVAGYVGQGLNSEALEVFNEMRRVGEKPDEVTMLSLLSACAELGDLEVGTKIHGCVVEMGSGDLNVTIGNSVINMYGKCGSIENAIRVFRQMGRRDVTTWNSVICVLAYHGHAEEALALFEEMLGSRVKPDEITFVGVFVACSHAGKVNEGRGYFELMRTKYRVRPNVKHYGCMVDVLGRAGLLGEALEFIEAMEVEPNAIVWRALLGACKVHGNVELGRRASKELGKMGSDESGNFVLLSNIYALQGEWDGAERVRKSMNKCGVVKEAGLSLIDISNL